MIATSPRQGDADGSVAETVTAWPFSRERAAAYLAFMVAAPLGIGVYAWLRSTGRFGEETGAAFAWWAAGLTALLLFVPALEYLLVCVGGGGIRATPIGLELRFPYRRALILPWARITAIELGSYSTDIRDGAVVAPGRGTGQVLTIRLAVPLAEGRPATLLLAWSTDRLIRVMGTFLPRPIEAVAAQMEAQRRSRGVALDPG